MFFNTKIMSSCVTGFSGKVADLLPSDLIFKEPRGDSFEARCARPFTIGGWLK